MEKEPHSSWMRWLVPSNVDALFLLIDDEAFSLKHQGNVVVALGYRAIGLDENDLIAGAVDDHLLGCDAVAASTGDHAALVAVAIDCEYVAVAVLVAATVTCSDDVVVIGDGDCLFGDD